MSCTLKPTREVMIAVVSRVLEAEVFVADESVGRIDRGLLIYLGVLTRDTESDADRLADKLLAIRLFNDEQGRINQSLQAVGGSLLIVSNFTLAGRTTKGTRPSFTDAAAPDLARMLVDRVVGRGALEVPVATGRFGADMRVRSVAEGPVNVLICCPE